MSSFFAFVEEYGEEDGEIVDTIFMTSVKEYMQSAKENLQSIRLAVHSIKDLLSTVPFVGIVVKTVPFCDGLQTTPWLFGVQGISHTIPLATTYDLLVSGIPNATTSQADESLILVGCNHGKHTHFMAHLQTYLICKNWALRFTEARLAGVGALVCFLLQEHPEVKEWMQRFLAYAADVSSGFDFATYRRGALYLGYIKDEEKYKYCLVNDSPLLEDGMKCEGLTKFVWALWHSIHVEKFTFSGGVLQRMHIAFLREWVGRSRVSVKHFFEIKSAQQQERPLFVALKKRMLTEYCVMAHLQRAFAEASEGRKEVAFVPERLLELRFSGLTLEGIDNLFTNLGSPERLKDNVALLEAVVKGANHDSWSRNTVENCGADQDIFALHFARDDKEARARNGARLALKAYQEYFFTKHDGLPFRISKDLADKYKVPLFFERFIIVVLTPA